MQIPNRHCIDSNPSYANEDNKKITVNEKYVPVLFTTHELQISNGRRRMFGFHSRLSPRFSSIGCQSSTTRSCIWLSYVTCTWIHHRYLDTLHLYLFPVGAVCMKFCIGWIKWRKVISVLRPTSFRWLQNHPKQSSFEFVWSWPFLANFLSEVSQN